MENDSNITASVKTMRVYQLGRPGRLDGLVVRERDGPSPAVGEVLVRVRASSLNVRDLVIINGEFPMPVPPGRVPLSDGAGEVVAVGAGVTRFKVGDRVINSFFPNWFGGTFNAMPVQYVVDCDGWLTEYKAVSAEALVAMPGYLTFEQAATAMRCRDGVVCAIRSEGGKNSPPPRIGRGFAVRASTGQGARRTRDRDVVQSGERGPSS